MAVFETTKYIYRDLKTGRLIHRRQAEKRPADTWQKEAFVTPEGLEKPFVEHRSGRAPVMDINEEAAGEAAAMSR